MSAQTHEKIWTSVRFSRSGPAVTYLVCFQGFELRHTWIAYIRCDSITQYHFEVAGAPFPIDYEVSIFGNFCLLKSFIEKMQMQRPMRTAWHTDTAGASVGPSRLVTTLSQPQRQAVKIPCGLWGPGMRRASHKYMKYQSHLSWREGSFTCLGAQRLQAENWTICQWKPREIFFLVAFLHFFKSRMPVSRLRTSLYASKFMDGFRSGIDLVLQGHSPQNNYHHNHNQWMKGWYFYGVYVQAAESKTFSRFANEAFSLFKRYFLCVLLLSCSVITCCFSRGEITNLIILEFTTQIMEGLLIISHVFSV
jgi:hypothetical protein